MVNRHPHKKTLEDTVNNNPRKNNYFLESSCKHNILGTPWVGWDHVPTNFNGDNLEFKLFMVSVFEQSPWNKWTKQQTFTMYKHIRKLVSWKNIVHHETINREGDKHWNIILFIGTWF